MRTRNMQERHGFTLIELLLGSVISAVLLAALYAIFQGLLYTQARSNKGLEEIVPRGQIAALMKIDLENMAAPNGLLCGNVFGEHGGDGDHCSDALEFSTTSGRVAAAMPWGEVQKIEYYLASCEYEDEDAGSDLQLVRAVTRNLLAVNVEDEPEITVLLDKVQSLEFEYFDGQTWLTAWDSTTLDNAPPKAVRVRIGFPPEPAKGLATAPIEIVCEVAAQNAARSVAPADSAKG